LKILAEYEAAEPGERGALLRREGLYSSHLVEWRRARDTGALAGLEGRPRTAKRSAEQVELQRLRRDKAKVEAELARAKAALDIVGKAHALLELLSESADAETRSKK
jgi:transposase-like protein